jgi:metal-responsive CopG/Arc/MetJ family transcriptional regulator
MTEIISVGISFPKIVLTKIDSKRGDVSRSRYLLRVIENALQSEDGKGIVTIK